MAEKRKIPLGSPVIIDTIKSKYNLKNELNRDIAFMPEGIVSAYSNELSGEYLVIKLRSNIEIKVTENELSDCTINYYSSSKRIPLGLIEHIRNIIKIEFLLTGNKEIKYLLNPLNFLQWIRFTVKDIL